MDLSTNLVRRKEELEAIKQSTEIDMLQGEADLKRQELMKANSLVDRLTQQLKSQCRLFILIFSTSTRFLSNLTHNLSFAGVSESIDQRHRKLEEIRLEKDNAKVSFYLV